MNSNEDLLFDLIQNAETAKNRQFQFIRSFKEYINIKKERRANILLISCLDKNAKKLFKNYCKDIIAAKADVIKLMAYCRLIDIINSYEEELLVLEDMLEEYECYMFINNWLDFILGTTRPTDKLWDHRGGD
jgi:GTP1/Obg family GTP-binding protein